MGVCTIKYTLIITELKTGLSFTPRRKKNWSESHPPEKTLTNELSYQPVKHWFINGFIFLRNNDKTCGYATYYQTLSKYSLSA